MRILAVDPGDTIGYALLEDDELVFTGVTTRENWYSCLYKLVKSKPDFVIIEQAPQGKSNTDKSAWTLAEKSLSRMLPKAEHISLSPGVWKPLIRVLLRNDIIALKTQHEKDAAMLARFFARSQRSKNESSNPRRRTQRSVRVSSV